MLQKKNKTLFFSRKDQIQKVSHTRIFFGGFNSVWLQREEAIVRYYMQYRGFICYVKLSTTTKMICFIILFIITCSLLYKIKRINDISTKKQEITPNSVGQFIFQSKKKCIPCFFKSFCLIKLRLLLYLTSKYQLSIMVNQYIFF